MSAKIEGTVVAVSPNGDLITDISATQLEGVPRDDTVTVGCSGHETCGIYDADHQQPAATFVALLGSSGNLELAIVGESVSAMLGIGVGAAVAVRW